MRILLLGDAHGHWDEVDARLKIARDRFGISAGIQVGDLGIDRKTIAAFGKAHKRFCLPLHVIDGNHDDHAYLAKCLRKGETQRWAEEHDLHFQPRPSVAQLGGVAIGFMGGALHVALPQRHGLLSGAPNYIPKKQALAAAQLFERERPALVVTHSCPSGIGIGLHGHPGMALGIHQHVEQAGFDPGPAGDRGETALRVLWQGMRHRPKAWVFGHFHLGHRASIEGTLFVSLPTVTPGTTKDLLYWDSETLTLHAGGP